MIILCSCREETGIPLPCTQVLGLVLSQFESSSKKCSSQDLSSVQAHKAGQSVRGLVLHVGLLGCSTAPAGLSQGYPTAMCCLTAYHTTMVILQSSMYYNTGQDFGFTRHDALGLSWGYPTPCSYPTPCQAFPTVRLTVLLRNNWRKIQTSSLHVTMKPKACLFVCLFVCP